MRYHAELFATSGHQVCVTTGHGQASHDIYQVQILKELSPGFPLNLATKLAVDHGQTDKNLQEYTKLLTEALLPYYEVADLVFTHGILTTHFNLALTQAIWKLAELKPLWLGFMTSLPPIKTTPCLTPPTHHGRS